MKYKCLVLALALALLPIATHATVYNFSISDTVPWTDTGIDIPNGSQVAITATGIVRYGFDTGQVTDANGGDYTGQQFFPGAVYPTTFIVSLVGKIGGTTDIGTGTAMPEGTLGKGPGFIGTSYNQPIATGGRLFLGFNDQIGTFDDNSGSFNITLNVTPIPEPSIAVLAGLGSLALWRKRSKN